MQKGFGSRIAIALSLFLFGFYFLVPSIWHFDEMPEKQRPWYAAIFPSKSLKLGLDLRGGIHMVLGVDVAKAVENEADRYAIDLKEVLKDGGIAFEKIERDPTGTNVHIQLNAASDKEKLLSLLQKKFSVIHLAGQNDETRTFAFSIDERRQTEIEQDTLRQALETIRNRVDEFGVSEPEISTQGRTRIIIQLPGLEDPERARQLLGKTAQLEFKLVSEKLQSTELYRLVETAKKELKEQSGGDGAPTAAQITKQLGGRIPEGTQILFGEDKDTTPGQTLVTPYLIESKVLITGEMLEDARVGQGGQFNQPVVNFRLNMRGADLFEKITRENVQRRLAILLDDKVNSAPTIQGPIPGGHGQITLNSLKDHRAIQNEARDLVIVLRAGALPAPVEILENRSVGPSLGSDSIRTGTKAMLVGAMLVFLFMIAYYRMPGLVADIALSYNLLFMLAALAGFQATLTLPGIAGLVLTLGMAVDANIIIYERIREELGAGKPLQAAVAEGFDRAHLTIFDSNLTTMIAGLVLLQYGTGPTKGFAVTLIIGLLTSYFTSIWITKLYLNILLKGNLFTTKMFSPKRSI